MLGLFIHALVIVLAFLSTPSHSLKKPRPGGGENLEPTPFFVILLHKLHKYTYVYKSVNALEETRVFVLDIGSLPPRLFVCFIA